MEKGMLLSDVCLHHDIPAWMLHCNLQTVVAFQYEKKNMYPEEAHYEAGKYSEGRNRGRGKKKIKDEVKKN